MKIKIELEHEDIVQVETVEFEAFMGVVQVYAKAVKGEAKKYPADMMSKGLPTIDDLLKLRKKKEKGETAAQKKEKPEENPEPKEFNREEAEAEIKRIAMEGKGKGISKEIKEIIQSYGYERMGELPDEKLEELLKKVREL